MGRIISAAICAWIFAVSLATPAKSVTMTFSNKGLVGGAQWYGPIYDPTACHLFFLCLNTNVDMSEAVHFSEPVLDVSFKVWMWNGGTVYTNATTVGTLHYSQSFQNPNFPPFGQMGFNVFLGGELPIVSVGWIGDFFQMGWVPPSFGTTG
jgi:hypothetical protein